MHVNFVGMSPHLLKDFAAHKHLEWEIVCYIAGEGILTINDTQYPFLPGTIVCQPPGIMHSESSKEGFQNFFIRIGDFVPFKGNDVVVIEDDKQRSFTTLMSLAFQFFYSKERGWQDIVHALWRSMYVYL